MTKELFQSFYKKELNDFRTNTLEDKNNIKDMLRTRLKEVGYGEIISTRENEFSSDIKKN